MRRDFLSTAIAPTPDGGEIKTRYSDDELEEFRQIILDKLEKARGDLNSLIGDSIENGGEHLDTSPSFKCGQQEGNQTLLKEENRYLVFRQKKFITSLENALIRVDNKTYGICRVTGKLISKERLRSVPHATLCIEAKLGVGHRV